MLTHDTTLRTQGRVPPRTCESGADDCSADPAVEQTQPAYVNPPEMSLIFIMTCPYGAWCNWKASVGAGSLVRDH